MAQEQINELDISKVVAKSNEIYKPLSDSAKDFWKIANSSVCLTGDELLVCYACTDVFALKDAVAYKDDDYPNGLLMCKDCHSSLSQ